MRHLGYCEAIERHYADVWSPPEKRLSFKKGPIRDLQEGFCVLSIAKSSATQAFCTNCMSSPEDREALELHLLTRRRDGAQAETELLELLTAVAHYHRTGKRLGPGHTVNFGRPWLPGSACTHGLISLPYLDGPALEWMETPRVRFLWLVPITDAELELKKRDGVEALETMFEIAAFDYLDPQRRSVV